MPKSFERQHNSGGDHFSSQPSHLFRQGRIEADPSLTAYRFCDSCKFKVPTAHSGSLSEALGVFAVHNEKKHGGSAHLVKTQQF